MTKARKLSDKMLLVEDEPTIWCPGCKNVHTINVNSPREGNNAIWTWNGDVLKPTFHPSIHVVGFCHFHLTDGELKFCGDCLHELSGLTVPLPDIPKEELDFWLS